MTWPNEEGRTDSFSGRKGLEVNQMTKDQIIDLIEAEEAEDLEGDQEEEPEDKEGEKDEEVGVTMETIKAAILNR